MAALPACSATPPPTAAPATAAPATAAAEAPPEWAEPPAEPPPEPELLAEPAAAPPAATEPGAAAPPPAGDRAAARAEPEDEDPTLVTLGTRAVTSARPRTLAEAAAAERERRRRLGDRETPVIDNESLSDFAARGQVTYAPTPAGAAAGAATAEAEAGPAADGGDGEAATEPAAGGATAAATGGPRDEAYWRSGVLEIRRRWAQAVAEIERLEKETAELRWQFYSEDDAYYRDERIKPDWDRALDDLRRARQDARAFREELEQLLDEGRRAGALPGWLREGIELEPEERRDPEDEPSEFEPMEPPIFVERPPR